MTRPAAREDRDIHRSSILYHGGSRRKVPQTGIGTLDLVLRAMGKNVVLYDEDCGFCRWSVTKIMAQDSRDRLRAVPLQGPDADELLGGMDQRRKMSSWHLVTEDGAIYSGGAAAVPLFDLLPHTRFLSIFAAAFPGFTQLVYEAIARNREILARLVGEEACAVDPRSVARG
jgi:predicted DCC family thiol-disulfide oxidoreductase YuxK